MERTITIKCVLPYPTDVVWKAITDSKLLTQWFMPNDFQPELHREFTFRMAPQKGWDGITHCKVIALQPLKHVAYTYKGEATGEKALACAGIQSESADKIGKGIFAQLDTVLSFTLTSGSDGTLLEMRHAGFKGFKLWVVSLVMGMGWKKQLHKKLPIVLAKMTAQDSQVSMN